MRAINPNAAAWPYWLSAQMSVKGMSSDECLACLLRCAALDGVVMDSRLDALFNQGIRTLLYAYPRQDLQVPKALKAFMALQFIPSANVGAGRLEAAYVNVLASGLLDAIKERRDTGVDARRAMSALLALLLQSAGMAVETSLKHLGTILDSKVIQQDHPMMGVDLCEVFAEHFEKAGDVARLQQVLTMAFAHLPSDEAVAHQVRKRLERFLVGPS